MPKEPTSRSRAFIYQPAVWLLGGYAIALDLIAFWPSPVDQPASGTLSEVLASLHHAGLPRWINYSFIEGMANVLLFIPLGLLVAWLLPRSRWWKAAFVGLVTSNVIEMCQLLFLGGRVASVRDIMVNTVGALLGAGAVALYRYRAELNNRIRTALGSIHDR
ncbi:VanZ family protein [Arthrobacter sp. 35W]|uniref:VanZ family protein n=1 Tax=Arthrobacter sp. 35W TaxID=1132441 RepID=UPI0012DD498C|nr:VanZ family protein [Arthrobacter sp. 35W]